MTDEQASDPNVVKVRVDLAPCEIWLERLRSFKWKVETSKIVRVRPAKRR